MARLGKSPPKQMSSATARSTPPIGTVSEPTAPPRANQDPDTRQQAHEENLITSISRSIHNKTVIDIGAHRGQFFSRMLDAGFETVYAVEPHPVLAEELHQRFGSDPRVHIHQLAMAERDRSMNLCVIAKQSVENTTPSDPLLFSSLIPHHFGIGMEFHDEIPVRCRSITSMVRDGLLPERAGILKIDSEGYDLKILKGMPDGAPYEVVMSEYWGAEYLFANEENHHGDKIITWLENQGYPFSIHITRKHPNQPGYTLNRLPAEQNVWGNSLFFKDADLFNLAIKHVEQVLEPRP